MKDRDGRDIVELPPVWLTAVSAGCFGGLIALAIFGSVLWFYFSRMFLRGN